MVWECQHKTRLKGSITPISWLLSKRNQRSWGKESREEIYYPKKGEKRRYIIQQRKKEIYMYYQATLSNGFFSSSHTHWSHGCQPMIKHVSTITEHGWKCMQAFFTTNVGQGTRFVFFWVLEMIYNVKCIHAHALPGTTTRHTWNGQMLLKVNIFVLKSGIFGVFKFNSCIGNKRVQNAVAIQSSANKFPAVWFHEFSLRTLS